MVHTMILSQYLEMWNRIIKWQTDNNTTRLPNYVDVGDMNLGVNPIYKDTYMDMYNRVVAWQESHGGRCLKLLELKDLIQVIQVNLQVKVLFSKD